MIEIYGHPFASFVWKPLIALYERGIPFDFKVIDPQHPENQARIAQLTPTGQFPALVDGAAEISESNIIVEYLDLIYSDAPPLIPKDPIQALEVRELADVFDDYVQAPMQKIVGNALRNEGDRDARTVSDAENGLDQAYAWLDKKLKDREWAAGSSFSLADCAAAPALFYADWVRMIPEKHARLRRYRAALLARPSIARVVEEARPFRPFFPLGAPDRD